MSKIKDFFISIKENWNENKTSKLVKILSFVFGLLFGIIGIILVAIWKYIFSNNEEVNKHCIKLSIIGAIAKLVILTKFCAMHMFGFAFPFNNFEKPNFHHPKHYFAKPMEREDFFDMSFKEMEHDIEKAFRKREQIFNSFFYDFEKQFNNDKKKSKDVKRTEKVYVDKDGFETKKIEEKSPNSYKKVVIKEKYFNNGQEVKKTTNSDKKSSDKYKNKSKKVKKDKNK